MFKNHDHVVVKRWPLPAKRSQQFCFLDPRIQITTLSNNCYKFTNFQPAYFNCLVSKILRQLFYLNILSTKTKTLNFKSSNLELLRIQCQIFKPFSNLRWALSIIWFWFSIIILLGLKDTRKPQFRKKISLEHFPTCLFGVFFKLPSF